MNDLIAGVESKHMKKEVPQVEPGDTVRVRLQVSAGEGEIVYWVGAREAPNAFSEPPPIDAAIVGIVDRIDV